MARYRRCRCAGHWTCRAKTWVVTQRLFAVIKGVSQKSRYSELKCLQCHTKWRSAAGHIHKLPDYRERRAHKQLTDQDILELIQAGRLRAMKTGRVYKEQKQASAHCNYWRGRWRELTQYPANGLHVSIIIHNNGARKKIGVHKLVWMCHHQRLVPDGFDVHHVDDCGNHNHISNLVLYDSYRNQARLAMDEVLF